MQQHIALLLGASIWLFAIESEARVSSRSGRTSRSGRYGSGSSSSSASPEDVGIILGSIFGTIFLVIASIFIKIYVKRQTEQRRQRHDFPSADQKNALLKSLTDETSLPPYALEVLPAISNFIQVQKEEGGTQIVSFESEMHRAATFNSTRPLHPNFPCVGNAYFEVEIVDLEPGTSVGVGVGTPMFPHFMPGWSEKQVGWHSDDARIFCATTTGHKKLGGSAPAFGKDCTVGCGLNFVKNEVFYTLNGDLVGTAWTDFVGPYKALIGISGTAGRLRINFGARPFAYSPVYYLGLEGIPYPAAPYDPLIVEPAAPKAPEQSSAVKIEEENGHGPVASLPGQWFSPPPFMSAEV